MGRRLWFVPLVAAGAFYTVFVARSPVAYGGHRYFGLFDDAMISMRYGENLAHGHGLTWSFGDRVEGYSNFLWTLLMAAVHLLPLSNDTASLPVMAIGAVLLIANALVVKRIVELIEPRSRLAPIVATGLVALYYPLAFWALRGMEVGLAALLVSVMVLVALRLRRAPSHSDAWWLAAVMAAALLTRDDLAVPCVVVLAYLAWGLPAQDRRGVLVRVGGAVMGVLAAHTAFRLAYYDSALPNTYHLKLSGIPLRSRFERGALALGYTALRDLWAPVLLAGAYLALKRRGLPWGPVLLAAVFAAQCAYSLYVGGDAWEDAQLPNRYLSTVAPLLLALAALGVVKVFDRSQRRRAPLLLGAVFVAVAPAVAWRGFPTLALGISEGSGFGLGRWALAVAVGVLIAGGGALLWRVPPERVAATAISASALLALAVLLQVDGPPVREWIRSNYQGREYDVGWVRTGLTIRRFTRTDASIATPSAGSVIYFSERPGIDLLGKMDPVIANGPPQRVRFRPGHNKWNYSYSIGRLRPSVVTGLLKPTRRDLCNLAAWGYRQLAPSIYAVPGAPGVRDRQLARSLREIDNLAPLPNPRNCDVRRAL